MGIQYIKSPLRYPGGKSRAVKKIMEYIPNNITKLCSPFIGGASVELACTTRMEVFGYDSFTPLVNFWKELIKNPAELSEVVKKYHPLSSNTFYFLQKSIMDMDDGVEKAAIFFVLNRASFSGTTLSGGMSPQHPRFTISAIERLRNFNVPNFNVDSMDYSDSIRKHPNDFLYLDPPYMIQSNLYGSKGSTHRNFDHENLYNTLSKRNNWIMSYNDCDIIRDMYKGYEIVTIQWAYGMSTDKKSKEVLILGCTK